MKKNFSSRSREPWLEDQDTTHKMGVYRITPESARPFHFPALGKSHQTKDLGKWHHKDVPLSSDQTSDGGLQEGASMCCEFTARVAIRTFIETSPINEKH